MSTSDQWSIRYIRYPSSSLDTQRVSRWYALQKVVAPRFASLWRSSSLSSIDVSRTYLIKKISFLAIFGSEKCSHRALSFCYVRFESSLRRYSKDWWQVKSRDVEKELRYDTEKLTRKSVEAMCTKVSSSFFVIHSRMDRVSYVWHDKLSSTPRVSKKET